MGSYKHVEELSDLLDESGLSIEQCTRWHSAVYTV